MTDMPTSQTRIQLYSYADESFQNTIINTYRKFFTNDPDRLLEMIEVLVTQKSNPVVHRIIFPSMSQRKDKPIQQYLVHLRATATDCNFSCPHCKHDLSDIYIKDQFIRGIANDALQTYLLAKAGMPKSLNQNVCHVEVFELALWDQPAMTDTSDIATIWISTYCRQKKNRTAQTNRGNIDTSTTATYNNNIAEQEPCQVCIGCGSHQHGTPGTSAHHFNISSMGSNMQHLWKT